MKDLLKQIHIIVDTLKKPTSSRIDQLIDENNKKHTTANYLTKLTTK